MDPTLHIRIETISKKVGRTRWNSIKPSKDTTISWKGYGICFLGFQRHIVIDYLEEAKTIKRDYYCALLDKFQEEITRKQPYLLKKRCIFLKDNAPVHKSIKTMAKINELSFELLPHPPYSPDLALSDFYLIQNLKRWL